jgi:hypothetical protein
MRRPSWLLACAAGVATLLLFGDSRQGNWLATLIFAIAGVAVTTRKPLLDELRSLPRPLLWLSLLVAALLALGVPAPLTLRPLRTKAVLEVEATGERGRSARGAEVWVLNLQETDGARIDPREWKAEGNWQLRDGTTWVFPQEGPALLRWRGDAADGLKLTLLAHPWSGVARVRWAGSEQQIDLFRDASGQEIIQLPASPAPRGWPMMRILLRVLVTIPVALAILGIALFARARVRVPPGPQPKRRCWRYGLFALPILVTGSLALLALYPAVMSVDSVKQWHQAKIGVFSDAIPIFHTAVVRLLQSVASTPTPLAVAQILGLGALVAWSASILYGVGVPQAALWISSLLVALHPINSTMAVTIWKDVPFGLALLVLTLLLFRAVENPDRFAAKSFWAQLLVANVAILLLRHNGLPAVLGCICVALLATGRWKSAGILFCASLCLAWLIHGAVARRYHVPPAPVGLALVGVLGSHVAHGTPLSDEERRLLLEFHAPLEPWGYDCYSDVATFRDGHFNYDSPIFNSTRLARLAGALTLRRPSTTLDHLACVSSIVWRIPAEDAFVYGYGFGRSPSGEVQTIAPNADALRPSSRAPRLAEWLMRAMEWTVTPAHSWLFWRPALPLYLALLACLIACLRRRDWRPFLVLLPFVFHTLALLILIPGQDVRYQWPAFLIASLLGPAWLCFPPRQVAQATAKAAFLA